MYRESGGAISEFVRSLNCDRHERQTSQEGSVGVSNVGMEVVGKRIAVEESLQMGLVE